MAEEAEAHRGDCCGGGCGGSCSGDREGQREDGSPSERGWRWLDSTVALQRDYFGFDWEAIGRTTRNVAASLKDNSFAIAVELAEASVEYSWKHWATDEPFVNRERVIEELVDVGHFLANMLVALDVTDAEWEEHYQRKQEKNRRRMRSGTYSARKGGLGEGSEAE